MYVQGDVTRKGGLVVATKVESKIWEGAGD